MTLEEFSQITVKVLEADGVVEYLPTLAFPATCRLQVIEGIPEDVDHREALLNVVRRSGSEAREFYFGVRTAADRVTTGRHRPGLPAEFMEIVETAEGFAAQRIPACRWWTL